MSNQESLPSSSGSSFPSQSEESMTTISTQTTTSISSIPSLVTMSSGGISLSSMTESLIDTPRTLRSGRSVSSQGSSSRSSSIRSASSQGSTGSQEDIKPLYSIPSVEEITGDKLPSKRDVIGFYLHLQNSNPRMNLEQIGDLVLEEVIRFYVNLKIPTKTNPTIKKKIHTLLAEFKNVRKIYGRNRNPYHSEVEKADRFESKLDNLFDISQDNAIINDEEVKNFLKNQRKPGRLGSMPNISKRRRRSRLSDQIDVPPRVSECEELENVLGATGLVFDDDDDDVFETDVPGPSSALTFDKDPDYEQPVPVVERHRKKKHFVSPEMIAAMDYCIFSNPCVTRLLMPTLKSLGHNADDYYLSKEYLRRRRQATRGEAFTKIQDEFIKYASEGQRIVKIHWDGKAMQNITEKKLAERVVVKAVCDNKEQILGCPFSEGKKGSHIADLVFNLIQDWDLNEIIVSLCFDTTYVNSGHVKGAAIKLERMLSRKLQFFPCRHHIYELILRLVFEHHMGATKSDNVKLFATFKKAWDEMDPEFYSCGMSDEKVEEALKPSLLVGVKEFITTKLKEKTFRSDYREFLELALLFIGEGTVKKEGQVIFHPPGADHHARWMSKAIYSLKIFMFREQFAPHLTQEDLDGLRQVCIFLIKHYLKAWFRSPLAAEAPHQDFSFIKTVMLDRTIGKELIPKIIKKISNHLWYLEEETVALAFFDSNIEPEVKEEMVARLMLDRETEDDEEFEYEPSNGHRLLVKPEVIRSTYMTKKFSDFVSPNTINFFKRFRIPTEFLRQPVRDWTFSESYKQGFEIVKALKVTNDTAERSIQLMTSFVGLIKKGADTKAYEDLVVAVDEYSKNRPSYTKKNLMKEN